MTAELIQIILPLYDNRGRRFTRDPFKQTLDELTDRFGGVTAFTRAPAEGLWENDAGHVVRDDVVVVEVMADARDDEWWREYQRRLATRFEQETIVVRALPCRSL